jgi:20S proteasome alpha/beta subunit
MSLLFSLLREDHIIFGADSRHVRGTVDARYLNDKCCKVESVLNQQGILGFAGHDIGEAIVAALKRQGKLERGPIDQVAKELAETSAKIFGDRFPGDSRFQNNVEFLLAGFREDDNGKIAVCYHISAPSFGIHPRQYSAGYDTFDCIGKRFHGALYALRKCANRALDVEAGLRLAYFTLLEVTQYDTSVGGAAQVYVLRPKQPFENCTERVKAHEKWAADVGERILTMIIAPKKAIQPKSKRDR